MAITSIGPIAVRKAVARVALVGLDEATSGVLQDCFRQFGITTVTMAHDAAGRLHKEKFEALVVRLDDAAEPVLDAARSSPSNRRLVIYGIANGHKHSLKYSKFGVNTVLGDPVERQAALRVVRATHLLVLHELRRYARIPVMTEVHLAMDPRRLVVQCVEISGGGMSVRYTGKLVVGQAAEMFFDLPGKAGIRVNGTVCWVREAEGLAGLRFDMQDKRRSDVRQWVDDYLGIS